MNGVRVINGVIIVIVLVINIIMALVNIDVIIVIIIVMFNLLCFLDLPHYLYYYFITIYLSYYYH